MKKFAYIWLLITVFAIPLSNSALKDDATTSAVMSAADCFTDCETDSNENHNPEVLLYANNQNTEVGFVLNNVGEFDQFEYRVMYEHDPGIIELVQGTIDNSSGNDSILEEWIVLGFCSQNVCTFHQGIETVDLEVDLIKSGSVLSTIQDSINL